MSKKLSVPLHTFGATTRLGEAIGKLGSRVKLDGERGYMVDGKHVTVFELMEIAKNA